MIIVTLFQGLQCLHHLQYGTSDRGYTLTFRKQWYTLI